MIVQSAENGAPHFIILQIDHARMSGQLAQAFGNAEFAALNPHEPVAYAVAHHDEGWADLDAQMLPDPATGLPYNLTKTPLPKIIATGSGSPDFNERHHPYSGLLSSMHTYGLYHGRYGMSDKVFIDLIPPQFKAQVTTLLDGELARQQRIKTQLAADPISAEWIADDFLFTNYKLLQFFDTLALYFHMVHAEARGEATFPNVPRAVGDDVTVTIRPIDHDTYALSPWPFADDSLSVSTRGRYLAPQSPGTDLVAVMAATPLVEQRVTMAAG
jgi:hypothetical protein